MAGVEIIVHTSGGSPAIELDPIRIRRALTNLVVNSLRAMPAGGDLTMSRTAGPDRLAIDVVDTGTGIDSDPLPDVFDRFTKSDESDGSGVGLSIARSFVRAHGGDLEITRSDSTGATDSLWFPRLLA